MAEKKRKISSDEFKREIKSCEDQELKMMKENFFSSDRSYHNARQNFVYKISPDKTPLHLAIHRKR